MSANTDTEINNCEKCGTEIEIWDTFCEEHEEQVANAESTAAWMMEVLVDAAEDDGTECSATSFRDGGVLTMNDGFTLSIDGQEYQVTIVKSR